MPRRRRRSSRADRRIQGAAWRRRRREILARDQGLCQIRGEGCTVYATHVDHIVPRRLKGTNDPSNLRAACARCNQARSRGKRDAPPSRPWFGAQN